MNHVWFILFGLAVGIIARFLMPGPQGMGLIMTAILGIAGSYLGALLANLIKGRGANFDAVDPYNWVAAIIGSLLLLFLFRRFAGRSM